MQGRRNRYSRSCRFQRMNIKRGGWLLWRLGLAHRPRGSSCLSPHAIAGLDKLPGGCNFYDPGVLAAWNGSQPIMGVLTICPCGFDFGKSILKKGRLESYALIPSESYRRILRSECAILTERESERKAAAIGRNASRIGSIWKCPRCGDWLLLRPGGTFRSRLILRQVERRTPARERRARPPTKP